MVSAAAVGQRERITQKRVIRYFVEELKYQYLGDWHTRANNRNIEPALLTAWLEKRGVAAVLIFQTISNVGMCLFVLPVIGLTLPFFSYGGSSIVTLFAAMGMVSSVQSHSLPDWLR